MESVIPCEPNGSGDSLLSSTEPQQAVDYRDFCYSRGCDLTRDEAHSLVPPLMLHGYAMGDASRICLDCSPWLPEVYDE